MSSAHEAEYIGGRVVGWFDGEPCDCPSWPVMWWLTFDGEWIEAYTLDPSAVPELDADRYNEMQCQAWEIKCDTCGTTMGQGVSSFLSTGDPPEGDRKSVV